MDAKEEKGTPEVYGRGMRTECGCVTECADSSLRLLSLLTRLKQTRRTGWVDTHVPQPSESIADHSHRVAVAALVLAQLDPTLDRAALVAMATVHDCGEALVGDVTPADIARGTNGVSARGKHAAELAAAQHYDALLAQAGGQPAFAELWSRFEDGTTPEAAAVRQLDKLEMILQAAEYERLYWGTPQQVVLDGFFASTRGVFVHPVIKRWADQIIASRPSVLASAASASATATDGNDSSQPKASC